MPKALPYKKEYAYIYRFNQNIARILVHMHDRHSPFESGICVRNSICINVNAQSKSQLNRIAKNYLVNNYKTATDLM